MRLLGGLNELIHRKCFTLVGYCSVDGAGCAGGAEEEDNIGDGEQQSLEGPPAPG